MPESPIRIAAFGALNLDSYDMFREWVEHFSAQENLSVDLKCAGPYPNASAVTEPGRPLRADALKDPVLKEELFTAVADDALALGKNFDYYCMPCMSMIGFHDGVEKKLGKPIIKLSDALKGFYRNVPRLGVIHMRPAKDRIVEMFGDKAVTPQSALADRLLEAEEQVKKTCNAAPVEAVMKEITEAFRDQGLTHVLFARADAPKAQKGSAGKVTGIQINSYFDILAAALVSKI